MWKEEIVKSFRSLMMHRLRALLSTLGVLFGVVAVVAMLSIGEGAKQETLEQIEQLGMNNIIIRQVALSENQLRDALQKKSRGLTIEDSILLEKGVPHVIHQSPIKIVEASLHGVAGNLAPEVHAVTRSFGEIKGLKPVEGRFICDKDVQSNQLICVLGYEIAKQLGNKGHVGETIRLSNVTYEIVGVLKSTNWKKNKNNLIAASDLNKTIFIPLGTEKFLTAGFSYKQTNLSDIILQIKQNFQTPKTTTIIKNILDRSHHGLDDYQIIIPQELLNQANKTQKTFNLVLGSIAAISLIVGGIGIMNIMLANVSERTREIGVRRALGANKKHILIQFLLETLILTLSGGILGVIMGVALAVSISYFAGWKTIVTLWSIIISLAMASGVGLCSGLYPSYKAAQMDPIRALRKE